MHLMNGILYAPEKNTLKHIRIVKWNTGLWMDGWMVFSDWIDILCGCLGFILSLYFSLSLFSRGFRVSWSLWRISHFLRVTSSAEHLHPVHIHSWLGALKCSFSFCFLRNLVAQRKIKKRGPANWAGPCRELEDLASVETAWSFIMLIFSTW